MNASLAEQVLNTPQEAKEFGSVARALAALVLAAGAIVVGWAFVYQFSPVWHDDLNDVLVGPSMDDGLYKRHKWVQTVRAAAGMREYCENVLVKARALIPQVLALEPEVRGVKRWAPGMRKAMQRKIAYQYDAVRPCESAEVFFGLQAREPGYFPHLSGLGKFFSTAADAFAEKRRAPAADVVKLLKDELRRWDRLQACSVESKTRSVLGVVVRPPTWYVDVSQEPAFHGTAADAWMWLAHEPKPKTRMRTLTAKGRGGA